MQQLSQNDGDAGLSERRMADREKMTQGVTALACRYGVVVSREESGRRVLLRTTAPGGLGLWLDFDGDSVQPDVFVLSWCMEHSSSNRLNPVTFGGNVNPHHYRKATYLAQGYTELLAQLERGWAMCQDDSAYLKDHKHEN